MSKILIIAQKENKDILRSKTFVYMAILMLFLTLLSLIVSFMIFNSQLSEYNSAVEFLKQLGKTVTTTKPELHPLNLLRGVVDYVEIIGAILGIILGYISIAKEKSSKTLKLLLSRAITKKQIAIGKIVGNSFFVFVLMIFISIIIFLSVYFISGVVLSFDDIVKLFLFSIFSTFYIMIFFTISFTLSLIQKNINNALIFSFVLWLVFVLIFPQIGDTMDPDNQVPGGFFKSMNITHDKGKEILKQFNSYESIRTGIEQLSVTKHYEREMFAIFGIKKMYNDMSTVQILKDNWGNSLNLFLMFLVGYFLAYKNLQQKESFS
jgi:ABC-2 type transport system permease protein